MSTLAGHLDDDLRLRRGLGFQLGRHGEALPRFVAYLDARGATTVTVELAVAWARLPERIKPITVDFRLSAVRGFARYLHAIDPDHEIPPPGLLAVPRRRPAPYIYTPEQIAEVLGTARRLRPPLRAVTYETLFGLLAATGMRLGEAFALTHSDVDLVEGMVTVRHAKFDRVRLVPLHPSVAAALRAYVTARDRLCPTPSCDRFFVSVTGARCGAARPTVSSATSPPKSACAPMPSTRASTDCGTRSRCAPSSTATAKGQTSLRCCRSCPPTSTTSSPANTYWYLTAAPELMQLVAARLERHGPGAP